MQTIMSCYDKDPKRIGEKKEMAEEEEEENGKFYNFQHGLLYDPLGQVYGNVTPSDG